MTKLRCNYCGVCIQGTKDDPVCDSGLFQSTAVLCRRCSDDEVKAIMDWGANDIPHLFKTCKKGE